MNVNFSLSVKHVSETSVGELFRMQLGGSRSLAVTLGQDHNEDMTLIAILECVEPSFQMVHYRTDFGGEKCLSYGLDWEFELIEDDNTFPGNTTHLGKPGVIHVSNERAIIRLAPPPKMIARSPMHFDLRSNRIGGDVRADAIPIVKWRIWRLPRTYLTIETPIFSWKLEQEL